MRTDNVRRTFQFDLSLQRINLCRRVSADLLVKAPLKNLKSVILVGQLLLMIGLHDATAKLKYGVLVLEALDTSHSFA